MLCREIIGAKQLAIWLRKIRKADAEPKSPDDAKCPGEGVLGTHQTFNNRHAGPSQRAIARESGL